MDNLTITVNDEREDKTKPPLDPTTFDFAKVFAASGLLCEPDNPLSVEVVVRSFELGPNGEKAPTSYCHPAPTKVHEKVEVVDSKTGEPHAFYQEVDGPPDLTKWHVHLNLVPKEESTMGTLRAISRAVSREVYTISAVRAYGEMLGVMMTQKEFSSKATEFADTAPWVVES